MRDDLLTIHDKDGKLLVKATRSKNRLYKVLMEIESSKCLQTMVLNNSSKWHSRLGQIGHETLKTMLKKDLVTGIPHMEIERETRASCLIGKQADEKFSSSYIIPCYT